MIHEAPHTLEWVAYWAAVILTLAFKYTRYLYRYRVDMVTEGRSSRMDWKIATFEWIMGIDHEAGLKTEGKENPVTWVTRFFVVWVVGGLVVHGHFHDQFPMTISTVALAGLVGSLAELFCPPVADAIVRAIAGAFKK